MLTVVVMPVRRDPGPERDLGRLVNGEAVEVDVRYARLGSRALALLLDVGVQLVIVVVLMMAALTLVPNLFPELADDAFLKTAVTVCLVLVFIGYPTIAETVTNGRSLGKRAMGLRVVREDGGPIRLRHAFTRTLVGFAIEWPGLIMPLVTWVVGLLTMIFSPRGRRLGDLAAGTFVVHERTAAEWGWMPAMPPHLAGWAATLDLNGLDDDLALAARHFLARSSEIREPYQHRFAFGLADEVALRIPQVAPPGTPPWLFLAAVLAERRRRAGQHVYAARALTDLIWPGFGRLDQFTAPTVAPQGSDPLESADAEQTQPLP